MPNYALGTTLAGLVYLQSATPRALPDPYPVEYSPYTSIVGQNGEGKPIEIGPPTLTWNFRLLMQEQYNWLLGFCSGAWASVYVRTRIETGNTLSFATFSAIMWRPTSKVVPGPLRSEVVVKFTCLQAT